MLQSGTSHHTADTWQYPTPGGCVTVKYATIEIGDRSFCHQGYRWGGFITIITVLETTIINKLFEKYWSLEFCDKYATNQFHQNALISILGQFSHTTSHVSFIQQSWEKTYVTMVLVVEKLCLPASFGVSNCLGVHRGSVPWKMSNIVP